MAKLSPWRFNTSISGVEAVARLVSLGVGLPLAEIYAGVEFSVAGAMPAPQG